MEAAPSVHLAPAPAGRRPQPRALALLAVPLLTTVAVPGIAHAQDYAYTGNCSESRTAPSGHSVTRTFRARVLISPGKSSWNLGGYDYTYGIKPDENWGPHSDETVTVSHGYLKGDSPWHSPDSHTSNVSWVAERGWKAVSYAGSSEVSMHAYFDVPRENDPECTVKTATF